MSWGPSWATGELDRARLARGPIGQRDRCKILDLRVVAVARADAVAPGAAIKGFGVGLGFPHIDAAGDAAFFPADELLADKTFCFEEIRPDPAKMLPPFLDPNRRRQAIKHHHRTPPPH